MKFYYITFRSVTYAQRAERILTRGGYRSFLHRTPRWMEEQGCGYALKIWTKDIAGAAAMLASHQVLMRKIYSQSDDGHFEEITV